MSGSQGVEDRSRLLAELSLRADAGDDAASVQVNQLAERYPSDVLNEAREMARANQVPVQPIGVPPVVYTRALVSQPEPRPSARERLIRADPEAFLTFEGKRLDIGKKELENYRDLNDTAMQLLGGVHDQATYEAANARVQSLYAQHGMDLSSLGLPDQYSPELVEDLRMQGMNTQQQVQAIARENKLDWDLEDDRIDNAMADPRALGPLPPMTLIPSADAPHWWLLFDVDGNCTGTVTVSCEAWGRLATARLLAPRIAEHFNVAVADVLPPLSKMSSNLNVLLDTPQGWSVLGDYIQAVTGGDAGGRFFMPTIQ